MARRNPDKVSRYASVADYDSDEGEELPETRKQANVAAKRTLSPIGEDSLMLAVLQ